MTLAEKFTRLKTGVGGNREKFRFEDTFGMPKEEQAHITRPSRANTRILSELEFALHLTEEKGGQYDKILEEALDYLLNRQEEEGVLTDQVCREAEEILSPMEEEAKSYDLILAAHAHIDMNWMWSFTETVSIVLATFRSILNVMDQYPDFCFSQSQASVYKIVEEYDPELMERIKKRIAEGRWEVTASAWVETDKNMPSGESLLRHIQCSREYLEKVWGVKDFDLDFSPDTFGHSGNVPEIDRFGGVKYFYHCRGNARKDVLYRYQAPSGQEVLTYREPNWYNGAITPQIGAGFLEIVRRSSGLKTGLVIYGVGDHGGGPTRRDVERALEMMTWKIYPKIRFGTIREYFHAAESVREKLPVVKQELNYFAPGCYTTQSRIKRGNRRLEAALYDAEAMSALAGQQAGFPYAKEKLTKAWQDVLFTHFHDILTGSCVQDSREHAMGLFQTSLATANTQISNAMRVIAENIDTSAVPVDIDAYNSQSEGAGAGYGIENFVGVPSTERGSGRTRIFHIFNSLPHPRKEVVELTVWDWTGDLRRIAVRDTEGNELTFQLVDRELQQYWDHKYFRVLVEKEVPALGYTTVVLYQKEAERYQVYLQENEQVAGFYDDIVLENEKTAVRISSVSGNIVSMLDKMTGQELIAEGSEAGLVYLETECATSSAWNIGRTLKSEQVDRCLRLEKQENGILRSSVKAFFTVADSSAEVTYVLEKDQPLMRIELKVDWKETGREVIPALVWKIPLSYQTDSFCYDIPAGTVVRRALNNDVPGLRYGMALRMDGSSAVLISDSKYGYRGEKDSLSLSLINSSVSPDPYPERGIHTVTLWMGAGNGDAKQTEEMAVACNHKMFYQPSNSHYGTLPMEDSLVRAEAESAVITAVQPTEDGGVLVRGCNLSRESASVRLAFGKAVMEAAAVDLFGTETGHCVNIDGNEVTTQADGSAIFAVKIK